MLTTSLRSLLMTIVITIAFQAPQLQARQTTVSFEVTSNTDEPTRNFAKRESSISPLIGGICSIIAGVALTGLGLYTLAPYLEETDEHLLHTYQERFNTIERRYYACLHRTMQSYELENYINECMWQVRYYRIVTYKNNVERDCADLSRYAHTLEDRIRSLKKKLRSERCMSSLEYAEVCSAKKSLERLHAEYRDLQEMLIALVKSICALPGYKKEEREKLREEREKRHQQEVLDALKKPTYVYVERSPSRSSYAY